MPRLGEAHHKAKLTDQQVEEIRRLREFRPAIWSYAALAEEFGCGLSTVRDILKFKTRTVQ